MPSSSPELLPYTHRWTSASLFQGELSPAGALVPMEQLAAFLLSASCNSPSFFLDASQLLMNSCVFWQQGKKRPTSHLLRLRLSLKGGKTSVFFKFWKSSLVWWGGGETSAFWSWVMFSVHVIFHLALRNKSVNQQCLLLPPIFLKDRPAVSST